jgi:uncharacterized protein YxjI
MIIEHLKNSSKILINQKKEVIELFGIESRNKYSIENEYGQQIGFAVEDGKKLSQTLWRQFFGHWRTFTITIMDNERNPVYIAYHPFRFIFQRLELTTNTGIKIGCIQQRFGLLYKKFELCDANENAIMNIDSPIWKPWTFSVTRNNIEVALILKKWSGLLKETFTDADNFTIDFRSQKLHQKEKELILTAALLIDLAYFERKASTKSTR